MEIWIPKRSLYLKCENGNEHGKYAVAVMVGGQTGEHVPKSLSKTLKLFLTLLKCRSWIRTRNPGPVQVFWTGKSCRLGREKCKKNY